MSDDEAYELKKRIVQLEQLLQRCRNQKKILMRQLNKFSIPIPKFLND